jgi:hypothetical protein
MLKICVVSFVSAGKASQAGHVMPKEKLNVTHAICAICSHEILLRWIYHLRLDDLVPPAQLFACVV